jgi:hypothetical protein
VVWIRLGLVLELVLAKSINRIASDLRLNWVPVKNLLVLVETFACAYSFPLSFPSCLYFWSQDV